MFGWRRSKPSSMLGVDIGSTSVKILALSNVKGQPCIEGYACECLPVPIVANSMKAIDALTKAIAKLLLEHHLPSNIAAVALPDSFVACKTIQLGANLSEADREEAILIEASNDLTHSLDEAYVDFKVLDYSATDPSLLDVLMISARANEVNWRVQALTAAGLKVSIVDVESYAIQRALRAQLIKPWQDLAFAKHLSREAIANLSPSFLLAYGLALRCEGIFCND